MSTSVSIASSKPKKVLHIVLEYIQSLVKALTSAHFAAHISGTYVQKTIDSQDCVMCYS